MKKKLLVLLPAAMLMLASCGGGNTDPSKTDPSKTDPSTTSQTPSTTSETTSETTSQGVVVNYGTLENPLTVKEALEIPTDVEETYDKNSQTLTRIYSKQMLYVKGTVSANSTLDDKGTYYRFVYLTDSSTTDELYVYSFSKAADTEVYVNDEIIIYGYLVNYNGTLEIATPGGLGEEAYAWLKGDITRGTSAITVANNEWADVVLSAETGVNGTKATATVTAKAGMVVDKVKANGEELTGNEGVYEFTVKGPTEITVAGHEAGEVVPSSLKVDVFASNFALEQGSETVAKYKSGIVTLTIDKNTSSNDLRLSDTDHLRIYKNAKFTIDVDAASVVKVVFTVAGSYDLSSLVTFEGGTLEDDKVTLTANEGVKSFSGVGSGQWRISAVEVFYFGE